MTKYLRSAIVVCLLLICGCQHYTYEIEMRTEGDVLERKLTCWQTRHGQDGKSRVVGFPRDEMDRISNLYERQMTRRGKKKQVFIGHFKGSMPNDVGGAGSFTHFETRMGSLSLYVERFRGNDDLAANLPRIVQGGDKLADLLAGWFQAELGGDPNFGALRKFCDVELRQDIKNLGTYYFVAGILSKCDDEGLAHVAARACQYLAERAYFAPEELPSIVSAAHYAFAREDTTQLMALIRRFIARKMRVPDQDPIPHSLDFLCSLEAAEKSLRRYLRGTDEFKSRRQKWEQGKKTGPEAQEPDPMAIAGDAIGELLTWSPIRIFCDELALKLACQTKPFATNGEWNEKSRQVAWSAAVSDDDMPATFCHAFWSVPDATFQKEHFGSVLLDGVHLAGYVLWRKGLREKDAQEWDQFISNLSPGEDLKAKVESFRFTDDPQVQGKDGDIGGPSLADTPRVIILSQLESEAQTPENDKPRPHE